jgi:LuxR family maltose regulon positive regulatory protein
VQRVKVLRALVASQRGDGTASALLREARELAAIGGHARLAADTHPLAEHLLAQARGAPGRTPSTLPDQPSTRASLLTTKEFEVLTLLRKGLPNKAIARDLDVSGETVKSHLKNLFVKLSAGSRHHAVERARMLGLLP